MIVRIPHPDDPDRFAYVPMCFEPQTCAWVPISDDPRVVQAYESRFGARYRYLTHLLDGRGAGSDMLRRQNVALAFEVIDLDEAPRPPSRPSNEQRVEFDHSTLVFHPRRASCRFIDRPPSAASPGGAA